MATTEYLNPNNKHLLFILPGQSLSSRVFWDFKLPDNKTHAQYFYEAGIDVILFDPAGYGTNTEFYSYDRIGYADQITEVTDKITKSYISKTIFGFSTSTAPALCAAERGFFDKVIIHSPSIRNHRNYFVKHNNIFKTGIEKLKRERLAKISDTLIKIPNRFDNWEESILNIIGKTEWECPAQIVYDIGNYWVIHGNNGFKIARIPPILTLVGEFDFEASTGGLELFRALFPNSTEIVLPGATHFSMWEKEAANTRRQMMKYCFTLNQI